jgi:hypothetical protein
MEGVGDSGTTSPASDFCRVLDTESPLRAAIVFASDEAFAPLAINLALSLEAANARVLADLYFVDLGIRLEDATRLKDCGVEVLPWDPGFSVLPNPADDASRAQTLRPNLPVILPGYEVLLFIDADIWVQDPSLISEYIIAANNERQAMAAASELSWRAARFYHSEGWMRRFFLACSEELIGGDEGLNVGLAPHFNSGLIAARSTSPVWSLWTDAVRATYAREGVQTHFRHMAEQIALNWVFRRSGLFYTMDPLTNYAVNFGQAFRDGEDRVVAGPWPFQPLRGVHLGNWTTAGRMYLEAGMLFDRGRGLSVKELSRLESILR